VGDTTGHATALRGQLNSILADVLVR